MQPYKKLFTYWFALIIYDLTVEFCERWIRSWKLRDQMEGAARSGKQNIVEGSEALKTSLKMGIKLTNTARISLEEALGDFEDFLRQRDLAQWNKDDPRVVSLRRQLAALVSNLSNLRTLGAEREWQKDLPLPEDPEEAANLMVTLCHQATYLMNKQVEALERKHQTEGGYTEKLYRKRKEYRRY